MVMHLKDLLCFKEAYYFIDTVGEQTLSYVTGAKDSHQLNQAALLKLQGNICILSCKLELSSHSRLIRGMLRMAEFILETNYPPETDKSSRYKSGV